jgi:hypothetical protein
MDHATILAHLSAPRRVRTREQNIAKPSSNWNAVVTFGSTRNGYFPTSRDFKVARRRERLEIELAEVSK